MFLSYRRSDSAGHAGRLYDALVDRFGEDNVFMDVDSIEPGEDFIEAIDRTIARAGALIVVIGPSWLTDRLRDVNDVVRMEIEKAFDHGIRVIPVLVDNAVMPTAGDLPVELRALASRNAVELSASRFQYDAGRVVSAVESVVDSAPVDLRSELDEPRVLAFDVGRRIEAPLDVVWALLIDFERAPEIYSMTQSLELLSDGPAGIGTRYRQTINVIGVGISSDAVVVVFDPPFSLVVIQLISGSPTTRLEYVLASAEGGATYITCKGWAFGSGWKLKAMAKASKLFDQHFARKELAELAVVAEQQAR
ncbi:TIR domain-containing protein [Umezawaea endophytica]|uniref:TIR domain-containing protein n=1 Tax=Umezawaea endophytica TaxID=1654476 RepID=A0A9X2VHS4_9PSEU|nr:TIR domain-containing protein [Umezawaea endophytica]MCS7475253.1 TIR domain-containing protein [Umezawaea endophytica]